MSGGELRFKISSATDIFQFNIFQFKIRSADVGIFPVALSEPDLIQHYLYDMELRIYAAPSYLTEHGLPKILEDLHQHDLIVYNGATNEITRALNLHLTNDDNIKNFNNNTFLEVNNGLALRTALLKGLGIGSFWYDADLLDQKLLVDVFPDMPSRKIPYYYTYHRRLEDSPKVKVFYEFLNEIYKPLQSA